MTDHPDFATGFNRRDSSPGDRNRHRNPPSRPGALAQLPMRRNHRWMPRSRWT